MSRPPAMTIDLGEVVTLEAGDALVRIYPAHGGRLGRMDVRGAPLLRGPEEGAHEGWGYWGAYPLLPWCNRIPAGTFRFDGRDLAVPVNWADGTAIHGLTADVPWTVVERDGSTVVEEVEVHVGPYDVRGTQRFAMTGTHLDLELTVENLGDERVPVGLGIHPWFMAGPVQVPASLRWQGEPMPTGEPRPVEPDEDLRTLGLPGSMDRCYTGVEGTEAIVPGLRLSWDGPVTQVVVYTEAEGYLCVEPVTMANDGFALADRGVPGAGVLALDPGGRTAVTYRFTWD
jgi:aldose 1-epimerase